MYSTNKRYTNKTNNNYYFGWSHYRTKSRQNENGFRSDGNSF